ncbi:hypothetical protein E2F47_02010 [Mycobacterium eburneum]|nr:hypothetical protein [Mycobacterium eburneum]TDH57563.1 hypothetical protein E2F47_02010 [Mycobacterium eburneum]
MAKVLQLNGDLVRGFAKDVYGASDTLSNIGIDAVLLSGSAACPGTAFVSGLSTHATEQHSEVQKHADDVDGFGRAIVRAVDAIEEASGGSPSTPPPSTRDL